MVAIAVPVAVVGGVVGVRMVAGKMGPVVVIEAAELGAFFVRWFVRWRWWWWCRSIVRVGGS